MPNSNDDLNVEEEMEAGIQKPTQEQIDKKLEEHRELKRASFGENHTMNFVKPESEVPVEDEKTLAGYRAQMKKGEAFANIFTENRFDAAEKEVFANVIRRFNELWWEMSVQTWGTTKYRGVQVMKPPTDMWIYQELIYTLRPTVIIETGTFAGGSALCMRDIIESINDDETEDEYECKIITIDISDQAFHPLFKRTIAHAHNGIISLRGESTQDQVVKTVKALITPEDRVMVILDSDHSYKNVTEELEIYAPMVTVGSCLIVEDTSNTKCTKEANDDWYFDHRKQFKRDVMCEKLMLTFNRDGYYERL